MHRAALLLSTPRRVDQNRGLDTKVVAAQTYAKTLQGLTGCRQEAEKSPELLVAVLLLLAYFESFLGNYVVACGRLLVADSYFKDILLSPAKQNESCVAPLAHSLRDLRRMLQTAVPSLHLTRAVKYSATTPPQMLDHTDYSSATAATSNIYLQRLLDLVYADDDTTDRVWTVWNLHDTAESQERIEFFQRELGAWKDHASQFLTSTELDSIDVDGSNFHWTEAAIPPPPLHSASSTACFAYTSYVPIPR